MNSFMPQPIARQPVEKEMSTDDRWWERRRLLMQAILSGKEISTDEQKWLTWYEDTPNFRSRQHYEERRSELNGVPEDV